MVKKILIVDDERDFVELMKMRLESAGFTVVCAHNGAEALNKTLKEKPDLIVLDIAMPEVDGYTFVKRLRERENLRDIPVIIVTAYGDKMKDLFAQEGIIDYLMKPFETKTLLERIGNILGPG